GEVRAFAPARADRELDPLVHDALQEPRAEREAVTLRHNQLERVGLDLDRLAGLGQRQLHLGQIVFRDLADLVVREGREQNDLVGRASCRERGEVSVVAGSLRKRTGKLIGYVYER